MKRKVLAYAGNETVLKEEDVKKITHLNLAFGELRMDGSIRADHLQILDQIDELKSWNPDLKVCVSMVNHEPDAFTTVCADEDLRKAFAQACVDLVKEKKIDGMDLDWEYPCVPSNGQNTSPEDKDNFTATCKVIREYMDEQLDFHSLLTIAAGADLYYTTCVDLPEVIKYLDYICLMTYDLKCGFHALAGHHTQLYSSTGDVFQNSCDQAMRLFHSCGVPKEKLLLGAAFYSRKWENIEDRNHGFLQIAKTGGGYGPHYDDLAENYVNKNGYVEYWDDEAQAPYLFNGSTFLSYDNPRSMKAKCEYVLNDDWGGIFYWEHKCDLSGVLLDAIYQEMKD